MTIIGEVQATRPADGPLPNAKTALAALVGIVMVIPASIPALIVRYIYMFFANVYVGNSWIPYVDLIFGLLFPQLVLGMVTGMIAVGVTHFWFRRANMESVRIAVISFWSAIYIIGVILSLTLHGMTLELISQIAVLIGLAIGSMSVARD